MREIEVITHFNAAKMELEEFGLKIVYDFGFQIKDANNIRIAQFETIAEVYAYSKGLSGGIRIIGRGK